MFTIRSNDYEAVFDNARGAAEVYRDLEIKAFGDTLYEDSGHLEGRILRSYGSYLKDGIVCGFLRQSATAAGRSFVECKWA